MAILQQYVLTDAVIDVENLRNFLLLGELPDDLLVVRNLLCMSRSLKVEGKSYLFRIPDLAFFLGDLLKLQYAVGSSEVPGGGKVDVAPYPVAYLRILSGCSLNDLFDHGLAHADTS